MSLSRCETTNLSILVRQCGPHLSNLPHHEDTSLFACGNDAKVMGLAYVLRVLGIAACNLLEPGRENSFLSKQNTSLVDLTPFLHSLGGLPLLMIVVRLVEGGRVGIRLRKRFRYSPTGQRMGDSIPASQRRLIHPTPLLSS